MYTTVSSIKLRRIRRYTTSQAHYTKWENRLRDGRLGNPDSKQGYHIFSARNRPIAGHNQPPIQFELGALSLRVRRSGREARHSLTSSTEVA